MIWRQVSCSIAVLALAISGQAATAELPARMQCKVSGHAGCSDICVSIMAEVAGDRRLIGAHDKAVRTALDYIERHGAATRARQGGEVRTIDTGKLAVATFRHNTSRAQDPQLHTHSVILNATQDKAGNWRSVESLSKRRALPHHHAFTVMLLLRFFGV